MFPLPGAPRQQAVDPSRLQAFMNPSTGGDRGTGTGGGGGSSNNAVLKPSNARQAKRLFVSNIPPSVTEDGLVQFFNLQLNGLNVIKEVDPCVSASFSNDRTLACLEFKTPADATVALAFDGITTEEHESMGAANGEANGSIKGLSIRRPKDYIVPAVPENDHYQEGVVSSEVPDSPNKICVSNIPTFIQEEQVTMLLVSFGELKSFVLVKDSGTDESRVSRQHLKLRTMTIQS
jgi:splicing factor U2AF subunit